MITINLSISTVIMQLSLASWLKLTSGLLFSLALNASLACLGPQSEDYVLIDSLPDAATKQNIVAKVRLLKAQDRSATVEVIDPIKGVKAKQIIQIEVSLSSCSWLAARTRFRGGNRAEKLSDQYFIAGEFKTVEKGDLVFIGSWKNGEKIH
jgi:hypothetical protein